MKNLVRCIDCQHGGNNKKGTYICYEIHALNFWFKEVLNATVDCDFFVPLVDIGERMDVSFPLDQDEVERELRKLPYITEKYIQDVLKPFKK